MLFWGRPKVPASFRRRASFFLSDQKETKESPEGGRPPHLFLGCPQARKGKFAGSRPGRRGTFSCTRESTQRACPGGGPPGYPPLSRGAATAFRRPKQDSAPLPSAAYGLVPTGFRQSHVPKGPPGQVVGEDWGVLTKKARAKGHRRALCPFTCSAHPFSGLCPGRRPLGAQVCPDPVSTRPEAAEGTARAVVRCPPESRRRTPTDAPVALSGVLRGANPACEGRPWSRS